MNDRSDEDLVASVVAAGDTAAFETLVRRYQGRVRNWLRQLTRDAAQADDLAQETFIRAWQRAHTFNGKGKFASWLMKIAFNGFLQSRRRQGAAVLPFELVESDEAAVTPSLESPDLPKMLAVLGAEERLVLILCHAHGMSHGEVAEVLDMPLGTVKSHAQRGKAKIRERFGLTAPAERPLRGV